MILKKYRPNFFSGFEDEYYEVNNKKELLESNLCSGWIQDGFIIVLYDNTLMAINNEHWYVISILESEEDINQMKDWIYVLKNFPKR